MLEKSTSVPAFHSVKYRTPLCDLPFLFHSFSLGPVETVLFYRSKDSRLSFNHHHLLTFMPLQKTKHPHGSIIISLSYGEPTSPEEVQVV